MNYGHYYTKSIRYNIDLNNKTINDNIYLLNDTSFDTNNFNPDNLTYILFYHYIESLDYFG